MFVESSGIFSNFRAESRHIAKLQNVGRQFGGAKEKTHVKTIQLQKEL